MRIRNMFVCLAVFAAAVLSANPSWAQGETRFGVWDNAENPNNVMTYEPYEKGGMKITVSNPSNPSATWSYVTMFDGKFQPVTGQENSETAVEIINANSLVSQKVLNASTFSLAVPSPHTSLFKDTAANVPIDIKVRWGANVASEFITLLGYSIWHYPGE